MKKEVQLEQPLSSTISDFCDRHQISLSAGHREIRSGRLQTMKIGRSVRITLEDEKVWIADRKDYSKSSDMLQEAD